MFCFVSLLFFFFCRSCLFTCSLLGYLALTTATWLYIVVHCMYSFTTSIWYSLSSVPFVYYLFLIAIFNATFFYRFILYLGILPQLSQNCTDTFKVLFWRKFVLKRFLPSISMYQESRHYRQFSIVMFFDILLLSQFE